MDRHSENGEERRGKEKWEERRVKSGSAVCWSGSLGGGTEPLGGSVVLQAAAWHRARVRWTYKWKGGEERSETCVGVLSEILLPNDVEAGQGRLITAVRDVSDKISPEERVELQRWHRVTPIKAYLQVTASEGRVQRTSMGEAVVRRGTWVFWCHLPGDCLCVRLCTYGWLVMHGEETRQWIGLQWGWVGGWLTQPERRTNEIWHYSVSTMSLIWAVIPRFQTGFMVINNLDKWLRSVHKQSCCALYRVTLYK